MGSAVAFDALLDQELARAMCSEPDGRFRARAGLAADPGLRFMTWCDVGPPRAAFTTYGRTAGARDVASAVPKTACAPRRGAPDPARAPGPTGERSAVRDLPPASADPVPGRGRELFRPPDTRQPGPVRADVGAAASRAERRGVRPLGAREREALGVLRSAGAVVADEFTTRDLRAAFRGLARRFHPDAHPRATSPERDSLSAAFARVCAAYHVLCLAPHADGA